MSRIGNVEDSQPIIVVYLVKFGAEGKRYDSGRIRSLRPEINSRYDACGENRKRKAEYTVRLDEVPELSGLLCGKTKFMLQQSSIVCLLENRDQTETC